MDSLLQKLMLGGSTVALLAAMPLTTALAQSTDSNAIEQVVVSGSRVTIAGYAQPTPVTVVGSAQLESNAFANITDAVRELPQVTAPPSSFSATSNAGGPGSGGEDLLNLRNLGVSRTLVLFDSQRVVASNISGGVDVATLPSSLVQRVDVVTGGASAAWGSDAVAGVVNFVLNKNFTGFKADIQAGDTYNGLNREFKTQAVWGGDAFGGRGHFVVAGTMDVRPDLTPLVNENWYRGSWWVSNPAYTPGSSQPQLIFANNTGLAAATEGGIIVSSPKGTSAAANALRGIEFVGAGIPQLVNFGNVSLGGTSNGGSLTSSTSDAPWEVVASPSTSYTFFGYGRYKLTDNIQASLQLNYGFSHTTARTASAFQNAIVVASDNAYIPASVRAAMQAGGITSFTMGEFSSSNFNLNNVTPDTYISMANGGTGPSIIDNQRQLRRGVITLEGALGENWSWNAYYEHSETRVTIHVANDTAAANLQAAQDAVTVTTANRGTSSLPLGSIVCRSSLPGQAAVVVAGVTAQSGCIPLDIFGNGVASPAAAAYVTAYNANFQDPLLNQDVAEASMQGTLPWELPAGPVAVAFGAGYRKEAAVVFANAISNAGGFSSANGTAFPTSSYNVLEGFAEVDAPILKNNFVESLDVSAAGRITSYSTSGMVETWKLGATSQVIDDIRLRTSWSVDIRAPQLNELFTPVTFGGASLQDPKTQANVNIITQTTGNPNLKPEIARTISGGVVFTPTFIPGLTVSADWYSIGVTGYVATVPIATILNQCNPTASSTIHPGQKGNPNDPLCSALIFAGPVGTQGPALSGTISTPINSASETTSGMDLAANYTMDFWEGSLAWSAVASLNDELTLTQTAVAPSDSAGSAGNPKWRGIARTAYTAGPYSFTVQGRWFGTNIQSNTANTGSLATAATSNLYPTSGNTTFEIPFVAYLDFRGSYKWNDNIQIYGAIDNATNVPPPTIPSLPNNLKGQGSLVPTNTGTYDMLGRAFRLGIRFNY
jgi:outer membrane receptor protein involved in Fe transport